MKVLGIVDSNNEKYICEVSHDEYCKLLNKSRYGEASPGKLKVGDVVDLGEGYNFKHDINNACKSMLEASKDFKKAQDTMLSFSQLIASQNTDGDL